jgi:sensor histidine kinase YesM
VELALSQNPYYLTIDKSSGLPSNSVYDIYQDTKGFMWFATGKGLSKFDGISIKTFVTEKQTSKSGSGIQEDAFGRIWYQNFDGFLYYVEKDVLKTLENIESIGYFRFGIINNSLFVLQQNTVNIYDLKTLQLKKKIATNFKNYTFSIASETHFYVLDKQLHSFDENGTQKNYALPTNFEKEFTATIIQKYKDGLMLFSKFNNQYLLFEEGIFKKYSLNYTVDFIQNIAYYNNEIWICTPKGIVKTNLKNQTSHYFKTNNISFVYKNSVGNYWISTLNEGVFFIENFDTKLYPFDKIPNTIAQKQNNIIIGTDKDELYNFDVVNYQFSSLFKGETNHAINQLLVDSISKKIFFTSAKFRTLLNKKITTEIVYAIKDINRIDDTYISFAATNNSGLIKTNANLKSEWDFLFEKHKDTSVYSFNNSEIIKSKNGKSTIYNPINKTLYYATNKGLIAQTTKNQTEIKYKNESCFLNKLKYFNNKIYALSTNDEIFVIDSKNNISPFKLPIGYQDEKVEFIKIQEQFLYVFVSSAILEFDLAEDTFKKIITIRKDINITDVTLYKNNIYIASSKGILVKDRTVLQKTNSPKLIINQILLNDKTINLTTQNTFEFRQNNLKIDFSILSFLPNEKNVLSYQINNSNWYKLDQNSRILNLISLAPNNYTIKLKIEGKEPIQTLNFTIKKPFWQTSLFLLFIILISISVFYYLFERKIKQIRKKNQLQLDKVHLEKNLNQSKLKAIKSQMNPHFFYNALNTLQSYILSNEKKQAIEYLSKFSNLTRTILEATEKDFLTLNEEIKTLELYLEIEKARFEDDFTYEINVDKSVDDDTIKIPTLLLQPYVENAVKHGLLHKQGIKKLVINFEKEENFLKISIDDHGIGRKKSGELNAIKNKNHISFATEAMQNRIELLNQFTNTTSTILFIDKENQQGKSTGTVVVIKIPISY